MTQNPGRQPEETPEPGRYTWAGSIRWRVLFAIPWAAQVIVWWTALEPGRDKEGALVLVGVTTLAVAIGYLLAPGRTGLRVVMYIGLVLGVCLVLLWAIYDNDALFVSDFASYATLATLGLALFASLAAYRYLGLSFGGGGDGGGDWADGGD